MLTSLIFSTASPIVETDSITDRDAQNFSMSLFINRHVIDKRT